MISDKTSSASKGITAQAANAGAIVSIGAKRNKKLFDFVGLIISLNINLKASAMGCKSPKYPTLFGPILPCIKPITFLSK